MCGRKKLANIGANARGYGQCHKDSSSKEVMRFYTVMMIRPQRVKADIFRRRMSVEMPHERL